MTAVFADTTSQLVVQQEVGVGVNRQTLHPLDKEYRLSLETDRGEERQSDKKTSFHERQNGWS